MQNRGKRFQIGGTDTSSILITSCILRIIAIGLTSKCVYYNVWKFMAINNFVVTRSDRYLQMLENNFTLGPNKV